MMASWILSLMRNWHVTNPQTVILNLAYSCDTMSYYCWWCRPGNCHHQWSNRSWRTFDSLYILTRVSKKIYRNICQFAQISWSRYSTFHRMISVHGHPEHGLLYYSHHWCITLPTAKLCSHSLFGLWTFSKYQWMLISAIFFRWWYSMIHMHFHVGHHFARLPLNCYLQHLKLWVIGGKVQLLLSCD